MAWACVTGGNRGAHRKGHVPATLLAAMASTLFLTPLPAAAHGSLHEQIDELTIRIQVDPRQAALYLRRGRLHSHHGDWQAALADYDRAAKLEPALEELDLARGRTLLDAGRYQEAKSALDRFLARHPRRAEGLVLRARVCRALGFHRSAAVDYAHAIAVTGGSGAGAPELYLERARSLAGEGAAGREEALRALDEGLGKLGPIPGLQLYAIDLELAHGRPDAALARIDDAAAQSPRPESWWARRADILERTGRPGEALVDYERALAELVSRSAERHRTAASAQLEDQVRSAVDRLRGEPRAVVKR